MRFIVKFLVLLISILPVRDAQSAAALERGAAIIDPAALRELDRTRERRIRQLARVLVGKSKLTRSFLEALEKIERVRRTAAGNARDRVEQILAVDPHRSAERKHWRGEFL